MKLLGWSLGASLFLTCGTALAAPKKVEPTRKVKHSNLPKTLFSRELASARTRIHPRVAIGTATLADCDQGMDNYDAAFNEKYLPDDVTKSFYYTYELDCTQLEGQKASLSYTFAIEQMAPRDNLKMREYLLERQDQDLGIGAFHFQKTIGIFKRLTVLPGVSAEVGDDLKVIEHDVAQLLFANMGEDNDFMNDMDTAFFAPDVSTFLTWVGKVFGSDYQSYYKDEVLKQANEVDADYEMTFLIAPNQTMPVDFAMTPIRDCHDTADKHCI